jgi:hypothetical protein
MKMALHILLGAVLGTLLLWVSVYFYGLLAGWSPWSTWWWAHHPTLVSGTSKVLAFAPFVIVLGVVFSRLFRARPILSALIAMTIVMVIAYADALRSPQLLTASLRTTWQMFAPFLVGPPLVVYLLGRLRSNQRLERP